MDKDKLLSLGFRNPDDFSPEEVQAFRESDIARGYYLKHPELTDEQVRSDMARAERMANDPGLQAAWTALLASLDSKKN